MRILYCIYQIFIAFPVTILMTIWTAFLVGVGCALGDGHFWGYYPGRWWARAITRAFLLPVTVEGREHLEANQSYVFVANHQGAFDIFLIYGFLGRNFKWMMKHQLKKIPFVGYACTKSHQIFVDKRGPTAGVLLCWLMSCNCLWYRLPSMDRSTSCHVPRTGISPRGILCVSPSISPFIPLGRDLTMCRPL